MIDIFLENQKIESIIYTDPKLIGRIAKLLFFKSNKINNY